MKFSVPYNGDTRFFDRLSASGMLPAVAEIYFAGNPMMVRSGRRPKIRSFIFDEGGRPCFDSPAYDEAIERLLRQCQLAGVRTNLLLNFAGEIDENALCYVQSLIDAGVSVVTVGSVDLLRVVRARWPGVDLQNSVYIPIRTMDHVDSIVREGVTVFLLPPEWNRDIPRIREVKRVLAAYDSIHLKMMINEGCIMHCPHRKGDQLQAQAYGIDAAIIDFVSESEKTRVLDQPCRRFLNARGIGKTNFVHPSEIKKYDAEFQPIFKLVGRSFNTGNIVTTMRSYLHGEFNGDLREIIENFKHSRSPVAYEKGATTDFLMRGSDGRREP